MFSVSLVKAGQGLALTSRPWHQISVLSFATAFQKSSRFCPESNVYGIRFITSGSPLEFLRSKGYSDEALVAGMLKPFSPPTVSALQSLGDSGLKSLAAAVTRELEADRRSASLPDIPVYISSYSRSGDAPALMIVGKPGMTFFDLHQKHQQLAKLMECACGGIAACSTCHVVVDPSDAAALPPVAEAEQDMLDLAAGLKPTSRLGCQISLSEGMLARGGLHVSLPAEVNNMF
jgi:ferredoxin